VSLADHLIYQANHADLVYATDARTALEVLLGEAEWAENI
jgi:hypothetical protein